MAYAKPKTYAQWLAGVSPAEKAWLNRITLAQRQAAYRNGYLIPFQHGQYGGRPSASGYGGGYYQGGNIMMMQPPAYPEGGYAPTDTQPPATTDPNISPGTYQGSADGSSPSTMSPSTALTTTGSTTGAPVSAGFNFLPILLFGGAGLALFLFMRHRKAAA